MATDDPDNPEWIEADFAKAKPLDGVSAAEQSAFARRSGSQQKRPVAANKKLKAKT